MAFDGIFLKQITSQLQDYIPCKINRIHQVSDTELLFQLRHERTKYQLLISAHSLYNRINITNLNYPTPEIPSNFIMLLRKHILKLKRKYTEKILNFTRLMRHRLSFTEFLKKTEPTNVYRKVLPKQSMKGYIIFIRTLQAADLSLLPTVRI